MRRWAVRLACFALVLLACLAVTLTPASAVTFGFDASQSGFPDPDTASGSMDVDLTLAELIALPDGAFMTQLGAGITGEMTTNSFDGIESRTYLLDPRYTTSAQQLSLQVELQVGNPAKLELTFFDSNGWRGCIADPATCEQRMLLISIPGGFGPGVATGTTFDSENPDSFVTIAVPEPSAGLLLSFGLAAVAMRHRRGPRRR